MADGPWDLNSLSDCCRPFWPAWICPGHRGRRGHACSLLFLLSGCGFGCGLGARDLFHDRALSISISIFYGRDPARDLGRGLALSPARDPDHGPCLCRDHGHQIVVAPEVGTEKVEGRRASEEERRGIHGQRQGRAARSLQVVGNLVRDLAQGGLSRDPWEGL